MKFIRHFFLILQNVIVQSRFAVVLYVVDYAEGPGFESLSGAIFFVFFCEYFSIVTIKYLLH